MNYVYVVNAKKINCKLYQCCSCMWKLRGCLNIKMLSYQCRDYHNKDKTVLFLSCESLYLKKRSLYSNGAQVLVEWFLGLSQYKDAVLPVQGIKIRRSWYYRNSYTWKDSLYIEMEPRCSVCVLILYVCIWSGQCHTRADSRLAPSQWETSLQSNAVSHWLGANLESAQHTRDFCTNMLSDI